MRAACIFSALLAPLAITASPLDRSVPVQHDLLIEREARPVKPPPCVRVAAISKAQFEARSKEFAQAFIYKKDISKAFQYIAKDYINHNPLAKNGSDSAWEILSPIWSSVNIKPVQTACKYPQSWLNYDTKSFGEVVDRFRWEGGCIVEHWDQGEHFPTRS